MLHRNKIVDLCVLSDDEDDFESSHSMEKFARVKYNPMMFSKDSMVV
jgi:hypothetical protein